jgi:hypothetical protein
MASVLTAQGDLAEAIWAAVLWHSSPDAKPGVADTYEALHDAVATAPDEATALDLIRAAITAGTVHPGDLPRDVLPDDGERL